MSLPFLQNRSSITCSDDLLGVVRITKEMIENTCEVIGKGIKQTGREGEGKGRRETFLQTWALCPRPNL